MRKRAEFPIDNSSILFLSLIEKHHTNSYRFTMRLHETVDPAALQQAAEHIYRRFPTVIAGFRPGFFQYTQVAASSAPTVRPDPGLLLTMTQEELKTCAYRIFYKDNEISIEAFHALTDGYGAIASFTTLVGEYLRCKHGAKIPEQAPLLPIREAPKPEEVRDAYEIHQSGEPRRLPGRFAYMLPRQPRGLWQVLPQERTYPVRQLRDAAHRYGVSINALIGGVLAEAIMEVQNRRVSGKKSPVRIMVPADLRKMYGSETLRNFVLYALPTLEPGEEALPLDQRLQSFQQQVKEQLDKEKLAGIMAYNVKMQASPLFRAIPRALKCGAMRVAYQFFGGSNSSLTLTNLGSVRLPPEMEPYVQSVGVYLTPRVQSPYNCGVISYGDRIAISLTRFAPDSELEGIFFGKLDAIVNEQF